VIVDPTATTWLTAHQAAAHATQARRLMSAGTAEVTERTVRSWVARHHLTPEGQDEDGRQLFTLAAVARAELATRRRALRLAGVGTT
jgi:DNA-binding transcriptional MerR regulator